MRITLFMNLVLVGALALPATASLVGPVPGYDGVGAFQDVYGPPLPEAGAAGSEWGMYVSPGLTNYAGILFELIYDSDELSLMSLWPLDSHVAFDGPSGGLVGTLAFLGGQGGSVTTDPITAWVDGAAESGISVSTGTAIRLFGFGYLASNTILANNSDIDIWINSWIIKRLADATTLEVTEQDWGYVTEEFAPALPGQGSWVHFPEPATLTLPAGAFIATNQDVSGPAGYGIAHIPEPVVMAFMALGVLRLTIARRHGRKTCLRRR